MANVFLDTLINQMKNETFLGSDIFDASDRLKGGGGLDIQTSSPTNTNTSTSTVSSSSVNNQAGARLGLLNYTSKTASVDAGFFSSGGSVADGADALALQNLEMMGRYERLFWVLIFTGMVIVAAGGNTIVVWIVSTNKEMKSVTNYFLVNLSLADTMVSTLNVIFNFISMLNSHWPFGKIYCKISNFISILSISASVFTLTAISCDRYNAILHPLRPRMSHSRAISWILLIWTLSALLAMPNAMYSTLLQDSNSLAVTCAMMWPDGNLYPFSSYDNIYNIVILVVTYVFPILTMAILYYQVGKELWGYEAIGENIEKQQRAIMAKKKIVKMMIVVVIIFALCWLPYHAFFVINYYVPNLQDYKRCYLIIYWLAMSNSMYNPIIIYFMNSKFRHEFRKILCFICLCRAYTPPVRSINTNNNNINNSNITDRNLTKRLTTQSSSASKIEPGIDTTIENINNHINHTSAQEGDNVEIVIVQKQSANRCNDKLHKNSENPNRQLASDDRIGDEEQPFISSHGLDKKQNVNDLNISSGKLIDFANINTKHIDNSSNDKVWI